MKRLPYKDNCVNTGGAAVEWLIQMIDDAREITRTTFLKHVDRDDLRRVEEDCGYSAHPKQGLTMAGDYHVSYHKSKWNGRLAYYFRWSAIEYYFVEPLELREGRYT